MKEFVIEAAAVITLIEWPLRYRGWVNSSPPESDTAGF
jgi:hypothetical protein